MADVFDPAGEGHASGIGFAPLLPAAANALVGIELGRVERRHHVSAITPAASDLAVHAGAGIEPRGRDDDGVHERPLDSIEHGRLVTLVDDADRGQQHSGADVERARNQKVDIRLFQLELTRFFQAFDDRMLELELPDEAQPVAEPVCDEQHEAMEVEDAVAELRLVVVEVHVAGQTGCRRWRLGLCGCLGRHGYPARTAETGP